MISRFSARFGSKFWGSQACTVTQSVYHGMPYRSCPIRTYEALQRRGGSLAKRAVAVAGGHARRCCLHCRRRWRSAGIVGKHGCARFGKLGGKDRWTYDEAPYARKRCRLRRGSWGEWRVSSQWIEVSPARRPKQQLGAKDLSTSEA